MVWAIDLDDFTGNFCNQGKYPLINTLKDALGLRSASKLEWEEISKKIWMLFWVQEILYLNLSFYIW